MKALKFAFFISIIFALILIGNANAENNIFTIEPKREVVKTVDLTSNGNVTGNLLVYNGAVDFYVKNPSHQVIRSLINVSESSFGFTNTENGNYTIHIVNPSQHSNVTVELDYYRSVSLRIHDTLGLSDSVGVATVISPPLAWKPLTDDDPSDFWDAVFKQTQGVFVVGRYANELLNDVISTLRNGMPLLLLVFVVGLFALFPKGNQTPHCVKPIYRTNWN